MYSAQTDLVSATTIEIEIDLTKSGIPSFSIVGLPDKAVEESRERVNAALKNSGFKQPKQMKTVVSLAPADVRKEGPAYDLPIALGFLLADSDSEIDFDPEGKLFLGELALDGRVKKITSALPLVVYAKEAGFSEIFIPAENIDEVSIVPDITIYPVTSLRQVIDHLSPQPTEGLETILAIEPAPHRDIETKSVDVLVDFADIAENEHAKRALTIAAAGGHNIAMYGPPGTGKTMMAKAFCGILPTLSYDQVLEVSSIHSYVGSLKDQYLTRPPFRSPHHTASYVSVIGGGAIPKPGEVTLAHRGVLFLDEFPEFDKRVLESLREPLEDGEVRISRARGTVTFPSDFIMVAALNPPSEVYRGDAASITPAEKKRFRKKLSGPIMDRIDMWIEVPKIKHENLLVRDPSRAGSKEIQKEVVRAREEQQKRFGSGLLNAGMSSRNIEKHISLSGENKELLDQAAKRMDLSPRVYHKIIKLARTIADLENSENIEQKHLLEALAFRPKEII